MTYNDFLSPALMDLIRNSVKTDNNNNSKPEFLPATNLLTQSSCNNHSIMTKSMNKLEETFPLGDLTKAFATFEQLTNKDSNTPDCFTASNIPLMAAGRGSATSNYHTSNSGSASSSSLSPVPLPTLVPSEYNEDQQQKLHHSRTCSYSSSRGVVGFHHDDQVRDVTDKDQNDFLAPTPLHPNVSGRSIITPEVPLTLGKLWSAEDTQFFQQAFLDQPESSYTGDTFWNERFQELQDFIAEHGHVNVPYQHPPNPALAQWVKRQRHQYKLKKEGRHSNLTDEREEILKSINFVWDFRTSHWQDRFQELVSFKELHGHVRVTNRCKGYRPLAVWLKRQRRYARAFLKGEDGNGMSHDKLQQLKDIGVSWDTKK